MNWKDRSSSSSLVKAFDASQITFSTAVWLSGVPSVMTTTMAFFALEFFFFTASASAAARLVLGEQLVHFVSRHAVEDLGVAVEFDEGDTVIVVLSGVGGEAFRELLSFFPTGFAFHLVGWIRQK